MNFSLHNRSLTVRTIVGMMLLIPSLMLAQTFELADATPFFDVRYGASAFADIDNDGDQDVVMVGNRAEFSLPQNENYIAKLYTNDGLGNFTEVIGTPFIGLQSVALAFADVDGDNDPDLLVTGIDFRFNPITTMYLNDGTGNFTILATSPFENVYAADIVFADVDGDEDLDVFVSGSTVAFEAISSSKLYINDGAGGFVEKANTPFANTQETSMDVSDFDLDGDLDLLLLGTSEVPGPITEAYLNDGQGNYTVAPQYNFEQLSSGDLSFSDIDNDGDEDLLISGTSDSGLTPYTGLYMNDGAGNFVEDQNSSLAPLKFVSSIFCDFDNDGFEDLLMTGKNSTDPNLFIDEGKETLLYMNDGNGVLEEVADNAFPTLDFGHLSCGDVNGDDFNDVFIMGTLDQGVTHYSEIFFNTSLVSAVREQSGSLNDFISAYPNPVTSGELYVNVGESISRDAHVFVADLLGRTIEVNSSIVEEGVLALDVAQLSTGTYFVVLASEGATVTQKFSVIR
ncbi:MAG: T9SS type A sorting domain-containing protein [Saprospiraceae bacterium]